MNFYKVFTLNKLNFCFRTISSKYLIKMSCCSSWSVKAVLLDITGVLYESGEKHAISGSVGAVKRLREHNIPFRFVTNETVQSRPFLVEKLNSFGFSLKESEIFSPGIAAGSYIKENNLRPYLLVYPGLLGDFDGCNQDSPNCVVVGDAAEHFSYENMNNAFKILLNSPNPLLVSLGKGRYYKEKDELVMDLGGFTCALEYAAGVEAKIIGKPSPDFFLRALKDIGVDASEAVMVGDDISSDVQAAQKCGMKGVLVKTGKFRESDLLNLNIKPDAVVDNLSHFVDLIT